MDCAAQHSAGLSNRADYPYRTMSGEEEIEMLGKAVSLAALAAVHNRPQHNDLDFAVVEHAPKGWISRWLQARSARRAMDAARTRLEETSPHLLVDSGFVGEIKQPARRRPRFIPPAVVETSREEPPVYAFAAE
jgi:hypothetical protein